MPFPKTDRVHYGKNPIIEVICQLRFPTDLRIDQEAPAAFQERIRAAFPEYQATSNVLAADGVPPDVMQFLGLSTRTHQFSSRDGRTRVTLTRDFLALSVNDYNEWKDFSALVEVAREALEVTYAPAYYSRVGLRYRDVIDRKRLGLDGVPWRELLRKDMLGELADDGLAPYLDRVVREVHSRRADGKGKIRILHGLEATGEDAPYIIDSDFFTDKPTEPEGITDVLINFNRSAGDLFRWYVAPKLSAALGAVSADSR